MTAPTTDTAVWVGDSIWKAGGYYHRIDGFDTACGVLLIYYHGTRTTEATARDDWRAPCPQCWPVTP